MAECLYAGPVTANEMPRIVAACHFTRDALFLAEHIPQQTIASTQEGRDLLRFTVFEEELAHACAAFVSGRIFQEDRELRWEKQGERLQVVYLGPVHEESPFADTLQPGTALATLKKRAEPTYYYLFGERLEPDDLKKLGKIAQPGDFAVVRIPRILRYPVAQNNLKYARLAVCEYLDATTNRVALFRFQRLEAVK
jgi:hypothetical protein